MKRMPLTLKGAERLRNELKRLKSEERPRVIQAIAEARSHGDLSENAEYHAAREQQSFIEGRIKDIEAHLSNSEITDVSRLPPTGKVVFGATIDLEDQDDGNEVVYQIVGDAEADIKSGSFTAPGIPQTASGAGPAFVGSAPLNGDSNALSFMVNGMLDFGDDDGLQGFVGGGAGVARVSVEPVFAGPFLDDSDTGFAWQAIAGVRAPLSKNWDVGIKYRFFTKPILLAPSDILRMLLTRPFGRHRFDHAGQQQVRKHERIQRRKSLRLCRRRPQGRGLRRFRGGRLQSRWRILRLA